MTSWRDDALCLGWPTDVFFGTSRAEINGAMQVCSYCPVRQQCLDYALEMERGKPRERRFGVFGGMNPYGRYHLDPTVKPRPSMAAG